MAKVCLIFLVVLTIFGVIFLLKPAALSAQEQIQNTNSPPEKGWATLSGILAWVKPDYSKATQEKQLVLISLNNQTTILIGEKANNLLDKEGQQVILTGVYKPAMVFKGKLTPVLEVRFIDQIKKKD